MIAIRESPPRRQRREDAAWKSSRDFRSVLVCDARWRELCDRKFYQEPRTYWQVVFHMNAAAVFGDDARRDGQPQAGSAVLRRKMRKEKFVFVLRRNAVAGVRHTDLDGFGVGMGAGGDEDFPERRAFQCFRGIVNQIDHHAAN